MRTEKFRTLRSRRPLRVLLTVAITCLVVPQSALTLAADNKPPTRSEFEASLIQPVVAQVDDAELRPFVVSLAKERGIPLVIDRRVDASLPIAWKFEGEPFLPAINQRLDQANASARTVGFTVYLGPKEPASKLRTLIALRQDELKRLSRWSPQKRIGAQARHQLDWADAENSRELLKKVAQRWSLAVPAKVEIPMDLWADGSMSAVDAAEALSLILIQFDKTFRWNEQSPGFEIVPIPDQVVISRRHKVPRDGAKGLLEELAALTPDAEKRINGNELLLTGTLEDQEAVETLLSPRGSRNPTESRPGDPIPLSQRRFTITAEQVTVRDAIKAVETYGIVMDFDEESLTQAGIKLDHRIDLKLKMATIEALLRAICNPVGLRYEIDGLTITLSPRPAPAESPPPK